MTYTTEVPSEREEIEMLLPWFVTGKLTQSESERVAAYLARHPDMQFHADLVAEELEQTTAANEAVKMPSARAVDDLMARVSADVQSKPGARLAGFLAGIAGFFNAPSANAVRWAAAAAVVVVIGQAVTIGSLVVDRGEQATYQSASGEPARDAANGALVLVRFAPAATANDVARALSELDLVISDGPRAGGFFVVRLGKASLSEPDRNKLIAEMRRRSSIFMLVTPTK